MSTGPIYNEASQIAFTPEAGIVAETTQAAIVEVKTGGISLPVAESDVTGLVADLALKATLASPTFTGTPTAPTAVQGTNTTQLATTAFARTEIDSFSALRTVSAGGLITGGGDLSANRTLTLTGATIFTDLLTRDGSGSGLDADTLRGTTPTAAGLTLIDDADATAQRVTLGLVIGTNVQAYDADLAAIAGLTSAANKGITFTGSGTAATYDLTAAALTVLDDATVAAMLATMGGAPLASPTFTGTVSGVTATFSGTVTCTNLDDFGGANITIFGNVASRLFFPQATNTYDLGTSSLKYRDLWLARDASIAGALTAASLNLGGATVLDILTATATLDFGSTAAQTSAELTITVTGAAVGDAVLISTPAAPAANTSFMGYVSAADTVVIRHSNYSAGAVDPASGTYRAVVVKI